MSSKSFLASKSAWNYNRKEDHIMNIYNKSLRSFDCLRFSVFLMKSLTILLSKCNQIKMKQCMSIWMYVQSRLNQLSLNYGVIISPVNFLLLISCSPLPNHLSDSSAGVQVLGLLEEFAKHSFSGLLKDNIEHKSCT